MQKTMHAILSILITYQIVQIFVSLHFFKILFNVYNNNFFIILLPNGFCSLIWTKFNWHTDI